MKNNPSPSALPLSYRAGLQACTTKAHLVLCVLLIAGLLSGLGMFATADASTTAGVRAINATFDSNLQGWFVTPSAAKLTKVSGRSSAGAARLTSPAASTTVVLNDTINSVNPTQAGRTYTVTAWVRSAKRLSAAVRLMEFRPWKSGQDNSARGQGVSDLWLPANTWRQLSLRYTAKETGNNLDFNVLAWKMPKGAVLDVDDIVIRAGASPAPKPSSTTPQPTTSTPKPSATTPQPTTSTPKPSATTPQPTTSTPKPVQVDHPLTASNTAASALPKPGAGALAGFYQSGGASFAAVEQQMGTTFGAAHRYRDFNAGQMWPGAEETAVAAQGKLVHVSWETMSYQGGHLSSLQPAPGTQARDAHSGKDRLVWKYQQITNGSLNRYIDTVAQKVKQFGKPMMIDFNHEADDLPAINGSNTQRQAAGTPAEYAAAYRHIVQRFRAQGVTNVVWALTWSGWTASNKSTWWVFQQSWPGKGYVDVILWDPYNNKANNWRSFAQLVQPMYQALQNGMLDPVDPTAKNLRYGLGEFGSISDARRPAWLRDIPAQLKQFPRITYINYFSSGQWATLHNDSASVDALGKAVKDPYFTRLPGVK